MSKVCLISDLHIGVRKGHHGFLQQFKEFTDVLFHELEQRQIKTIIDLGDLLDNRTSSDHYVLGYLFNCFLNKLDDYDVHIIVGNHNSFFKTTNKINSLETLIKSNPKHYPNIHVYSNPSIVNIENHDVLMLPWICSDNYDLSIDYIENSNVDYIFSHLELSGFEMHKGSLVSHGLSPGLFKKYRAVYTGHYHHKSFRDNIHYVGAPLEYIWSDFDDPKGFHILDLDTNELEFIPTNIKMFHKIVYDDSTKYNKQYMKNMDLSEFSRKYLKVIVLKKYHNHLFDDFIDRLVEQNPYDIKLVENHSSLELLDVETIEGAQDTLTILENSVNVLEENINKENLTTLFKELYNEALIQNI